MLICLFFCKKFFIILKLKYGCEYTKLSTHTPPALRVRPTTPATCLPRINLLVRININHLKQLNYEQEGFRKPVGVLCNR